MSIERSLGRPSYLRHPITEGIYDDHAWPWGPLNPKMYPRVLGPLSTGYLCRALCPLFLACLRATRPSRCPSTNRQRYYCSISMICVAVSDSRGYQRPTPPARAPPRLDQPSLRPETKFAKLGSSCCLEKDDNQDQSFLGVDHPGLPHRS